MSSRFQRVVRWAGAGWLIATLAILALAWVWRGHEPPLRIAGESSAPLAFAPQGDELAVGSMASGGSIIFKPVSPIRFLSALDGTEIRPPLSTHATAHPSIVRAEYSPDGKLLAVLQPTKQEELELVVFDLQNGARLAEQTANFHSGAIRPEEQVAIGFAPDSSFIFLSGPVPKNGNYFSRSVSVCDLATGNSRFTLAGTGHPAVSPDSTWLATIDDPPPNDYSKNLVLKLHSAATGETVRSIALSGNQRTWAWPSFSPDGKLLAVYAGATTEVFDTATGNRVFQEGTFGPKFLADGTMMTVLGKDVQLWDPATWQLKQKHTFDLGRHWDNGDQISPLPGVLPKQSQFVVFSYYPSRYPEWLRWLTRSCRINACGANQMTLVDATNGSRQPIELHKNQLTSGAIFSPHGERIAIGYLDGEVEVWRLPPRRSYVGPSIAAALVLVSLALVVASRRRTSRLAPLPVRESS